MVHARATRKFASVTEPSPEKYQIQIESVNHLFDRNHYIPYMLLRDQNMETPKWFRGYEDPETHKYEHNTIHGMFNTKGCWMLMRSKIWNWPDENANFGEDCALLCEANIKDRILVEKYTYWDPVDEEWKFRRANYLAEFKPLLYSIRHLLKEPLIFQPESPPNPSLHPTFPDYEKYNDRLGWWGVNTTYIDFLNLFAGMKYNDYSSDRFYYPNKPDTMCPPILNPATAVPTDPSSTVRDSHLNIFKRQQTRVEWEKNIFGIETESSGSKKGSWCDLYLFKRNDRFTRTGVDTEEFK